MVQETQTWELKCSSFGVPSVSFASVSFGRKSNTSLYYSRTDTDVYRSFIYETKGYTLEQVDELYAKVPHAWQSAGFEPTVNFVDVQQEYSEGGGRRATLAEMEQSATRRKSSVGHHEEKLA